MIVTILSICRYNICLSPMKSGWLKPAVWIQRRTCESCSWSTVNIRKRSAEICWSFSAVWMKSPAWRRWSASTPFRISAGSFCRFTVPFRWPNRIRFSITRPTASASASFPPTSPKHPSLWVISTDLIHLNDWNSAFVSLDFLKEFERIWKNSASILHRLELDDSLTWLDMDMDMDADGVRFVADSGKVKEMSHDTVSKLQRLQVFYFCIFLNIQNWFSYQDKW